METSHAMLKLLEASAGEDIDTVRSLAQDVDPEEIQEYLASLTSRSSVAALRFLLENGLDPRPIRITTLSRCTLEKLQLFAEFGFDFKARGHEILTDVITSRQTLNFILDQGADINRSRPKLSTPVSRAGDVDRTVGALNEAAQLGDVDLFDYLVSRGADPTRSLALHYACGSPEDRTAAMLDHLSTRYCGAFGDDVISASDEKSGLRDRGPRHRVRPRRSGTPWQYALFHKNVVALRWLLDRGASAMPDDWPDEGLEVSREDMERHVAIVEENRRQAVAGSG